ncbi:MAG: hypothetical protein ACRECO_13550, partial [Xanthobacteraceae bacterium]
LLVKADNSVARSVLANVYALLTAAPYRVNRRLVAWRGDVAMAAQIKRFNWLKRPTGWQFVQAWRASRRTMAQRFQQDAAVASSAFVAAQNNLIVGMAAIAAKTSIQRTQNEISAVKNQIASQVNLLA